MNNLKQDDHTREQSNETREDWEADLCDISPDNCWIDRATGEHVNATTNQRTANHNETYPD